ncbi:cation-transporting P-type ATPase [Gramella lutea]|uniref:Cation-transporting P-type ATPase n=1 Tax=Christiangramia lutea TaxID=1607951 RepID=A0A9X1V598_9FLAO|nr:cation-transporting P-type ATPase [Christiangramia lutea]MCH4822953.1 cation-transporting P-type ATPase [Christiangramia lutea]
MLKNAYNLSVKEVIDRLQSDPDNGLSSNAVNERLKRFGENKLTRNKPKTAWQILLDQFLSPIVYILVGAMFLALFFNEILEAIAILLVIIINTAIGFFMEFQAVKSFTALKKMVQTRTMVVRDGVTKEMASISLVPGDIIFINEGDVIPADARLIEQSALLLKESMLTGESEDVPKNLEKLSLGLRITEQKNMVFNGTVVSRGNAKAIVCATGDKTAIGEINIMTQKAEDRSAPLQKKLTTLTYWLIIFTLVLAAIIAVSGFFTSADTELMLKTAIALAVAAIPEGLPVVATITLARGMVKLSKQQVVIKNLDSVQTLGETNTICTDKTGTLTENKMKVRTVEFEDHKIELENGIERLPNKTRHNVFEELVRVAVLCNYSNPAKLNKHGDVIDQALMEFTSELGINVEKIIKDHPESHDYPFDVELKLMATVNHLNKEFLVCVKGAPENVLQHCTSIMVDDKVVPLTDKKYWLDKIDLLASKGLKVLAFARKIIKSKETNKHSCIDKLTLLGIVGFLDPPREDIKQTIQIYREAGIDVKMLTGDHPGTAMNIAESIGIFENEELAKRVIVGADYSDFNNIDSDEKSGLLRANVFARMLPQQKLQLIKFFQKNQGVVGMLGDGVNDAPALKAADIGIAMGIRGTEAAKEAADVILLDDKFTAIKLAIHQGRAIFENIRYFVIFLISCNLAEVISVSVASFTKLPMPLLPMQILYLNLVTDIFPALALGLGKGSKGIMKNKPRPPGEAILTRKHWSSTVMYGISITLSVIGVVIYAHGFMKASFMETNNMAFNTLVFAQLINVFNLPGRKTSFWKNEITQNKWIWIALALSVIITYLGYSIPFLSDVLSLGDLSFYQVYISILFAVLSLVISQILKRSGVIS